MTTFQIVEVIGIFVSLLALVGFNRLLDKELREEKELNDRRDAANSKAFLHMARNFAKMNDELNDYRAENLKLKDRLDKLEARLSELPMEELGEEVKRMASWNDGWSEIVNFGKDIPKLNKEGLKHE